MGLCAAGNERDASVRAREHDLWLVGVCVEASHECNFQIMMLFVRDRNYHLWSKSITLLSWSCRFDSRALNWARRKKIWFNVFLRLTPFFLLVFYIWCPRSEKRKLQVHVTSPIQCSLNGRKCTIVVESKINQSQPDFTKSRAGYILSVPGNWRGPNPRAADFTPHLLFVVFLQSGRGSVGLGRLNPRIPNLCQTPAPL